MSGHSTKAIIIGSGVAGLASAVRLAVNGMHVTVFEKNGEPGGKLGYFEEKGFHFDTGPSLFTQPENLEELFTLAGENIQDYFRYKTVDVACNYFFEDGIRLTAYADIDRFAQELSAKIHEQPEMLLKYLQQSERLYNNIGSVFLNHSLHRFRSLLKASITKAVASAKWKYLFGTLHAINESSFTKPHTIQLFNRYATYNGSNPYKAPGMLSLIPHLEYNQGVYYPEGGMIDIVNALYLLALKKGVTFNFGKPVQRIINSEGKVKGVVADNENILADIVVSNMDVYGTYKYLLNDDITAAKLLKQERSSSALVFYWGIAKEFPELDLHNIFFSNDYKNEFDHLFHVKNVYSDPTVYINITSKCEPAVHAPAGKENWFVMINVPANSGQDWASIRRQSRANIIAKLNRLLQTDIESFIETERVLDPVTIEAQTNSFMGSIYGTSSNSRMAAFLRHPNFSKMIKGLYFAGGSVHPGGGIPLCLKSAKIMSELVMHDLKERKQH